MYRQQRGVASDPQPGRRILTRTHIVQVMVFRLPEIVSIPAGRIIVIIPAGRITNNVWLWLVRDGTVGTITSSGCLES